MGDNRGDDSGVQPAAFHQILQAINATTPSLVLNTGDMIYGHSKDEDKVREYWRKYREALSRLQAPIFHVPGNHDVWDEQSAGLYQELCGPLYYTFDFGRVRFIALDTETEAHRIGPAQFTWLKRQLELAENRPVFLFFHQPLFPLDPAVGLSLDRNPAERDQLHRLFVLHRQKIKAVLMGHEHLYHFHEHDGVPYYITGGGGANLYAPPELGGFHHFLLVKVDGDTVAVAVKKVGAPTSPLLPPRRVAPGEVLESWEQGLFWYPWNYTVNAGIETGRATEGNRGLRLGFDLAQNAWPVLGLPRRTAWDLKDVEALNMDVYVPENINGAFTITPGVQGKEDHEAPKIELKRGWNTVRTELNGPWLPSSERTAVRSVGWSLTSDDQRLRGFVVFDNFRAERRTNNGAVSRELLESWERPFLWRAADESSHAESTPALATDGRNGLKFHFDFSSCRRPTLMTQLNPPLDLSRIGTLEVDVYAQEIPPAGLSISLGVRYAENGFASPARRLQKGWNKLTVELSGTWLPTGTRAASEQINFVLSSPDQESKGWIVFDNLRAGKQPP